MAEYISFQPSDNFSTKLYTGNASTNIISGIGFDPAFTWIKERDGANNHEIFDTARGDDKHLEANLTNGEATESGAFAFGTDQFTLGNWTPVNGSGNLQVSWNWKGGTTSIPSGGTLSVSSCSYNVTGGFGVYLYEGNSTSGATLAHGLGTAPGFVLVKSIAAGNDWYVQHSSINPNEFLRLNTTIAATADTSIWNNVAASSTLVTLGNAGELNSTSYNYIMYVFSPKKGFSKFETFDGNGNANGPFIYTGFRPSMMFIKKAGGTGDWMLFDDKRLGYNPDNNALNPNLTDAAGTTDYLDILSNGFKLRTSDALVNGSATQYVYAAFAEFPIVSSNDVPVVAR